MQMFMSYLITVKMTGSWNGYLRLCVLVCLFVNSDSDVVANRCVCVQRKVGPFLLFPVRTTAWEFVFMTAFFWHCSGPIELGPSYRGTGR